MAMIDDIVEILIEELRELPNGTEATLAQLVNKCGYDARQLERDDQMLTIYGELRKAARKAHITLDWSAYKDMVIGLPYNIPFVVKNARAQIKCPRCGSVNTARILYGMPAMEKELEAKMNAGKICIGGCCITGFDEKYYCNACKKKFGAVAQIIHGEEIEFLADAVTEITFSRTEYLRPFLLTQVTVTKTAKGAHVKASGAADDLPFENEYDISKKKWDALVDTLYYELYLNDWKHSFNDYDVLDGEEWKLTIKLTERRKRTYSGMNGYPPYWEELVKLMFCHNCRPFCRQAVQVYYTKHLCKSKCKYFDQECKEKLHFVFQSTNL